MKTFLKNEIIYKPKKIVSTYFFNFFHMNKKYKANSNVFLNKRNVFFSKTNFSTLKIEIQKKIEEIRLESINIPSSIKDLNIINSISFSVSNTSSSLSSSNENENIINIRLNLHKEHRNISKLIVTSLKSREEYYNYKILVSLAGVGKESKESNVEKGSSQQSQHKNIKNIKYIIAVSSCKGGVGKSTIAVNLACSLRLLNKKIGIFDADIHGPSLPILMNTTQKQAYADKDDKSKIIPVEYDNIKLMSYGFAAPNKKAVVRGPIISSILSQLLLNTDWGELDYLIIDFPPGTGDIQLSLCQEVQISGAVIVTTPQRLAFVDVIKGIEMFDDLKIPILAAVENMSYFQCETCTTKHRIYGDGYLSMLMNQFGIERSYSIPIEKRISSTGDAGSPYVLMYKHLLNNENIENNESLEGRTSNIMTEFKQMAVDIDDTLMSGEMMRLIKPPSVEYNKSENEILVTDDKNVIKRIPSRHLRLNCICAACIDEMNGKVILDKSKVPIDVYPLKIEVKGNYAVAVVWSDGHRSSIYPYKRLMNM